MFFLIIVYCVISYIVVGAALMDTYAGNPKAWLSWLPLSPILFLMYIIGSILNR